MKKMEFLTSDQPDRRTRVKLPHHSKHPTVPKQRQKHVTNSKNKCSVRSMEV